MNITLGFILLVIGIIGIVVSVIFMIIIHKRFKKKEKELLKMIRNE